MPICEGCGFIYEESFKFCPQCGREKPEPIETKPKIMNEVSPRSCPVCHMMDRAEKVTEIRRYQTQDLNGSVPVSHTYTDNKGKTNSYTSFDSFSGTQKSRLAQELEPPKKPPLPTKHGCGTWFLLGLLIYPGFAVGIVFLVIPFTISSEPGYNPSGGAFAGLLMGLLWLGFMVFLLRKWIKRFRQQNDNYKINLDKYNQSVPKWQMAVQKWEKLYYCYRDGVVFFPGSSSFVPIDKMIEFMYSEDVVEPESSV